MSNTSVGQLATKIGMPVSRLLDQMKSAGLDHQQETDIVSDKDKQVLLTSLRASHGSSEDKLKPMTLKRNRSIDGVAKVRSIDGDKTVQVEVRKKRTLVKPNQNDAVAEARRMDEETAKQAAAKQAKEQEEAAIVEKQAVEKQVRQEQEAKIAAEKIEQARQEELEAEKALELNKKLEAEKVVAAPGV